MNEMRNILRRKGAWLVLLIEKNHSVPLRLISKTSVLDDAVTG